MYLLLILCILLYFPNSFIAKKSSTHTKGNFVIFRYSLYTSAFSVVVGIILTLFDGANFRMDTPAILSALLFGSMIALSSIVTVYSYKIATVALTTMCNTISVIIPCIFGVFLFQEAFTLGKGIGIVLFFISAYLLISPNKNKEKESKPFTFKTLLVCCALVIANGFGSISMQLFSNYSVGVSVSAFMLYSHAFASLIIGTVVLVMIIKRKKSVSLSALQENSNTFIESELALSQDVVPQPTEGKFPKILFLFGCGSTVISFFINQVNTIITPLIPAAILFPSLKGGALIMSALVGWSIFKEKLSLKNIIGIALCLSALIVLNLF